MDVVERGAAEPENFYFFFTKTPNLFFLCVCGGGGLGVGGWRGGGQE